MCVRIYHKNVMTNKSTTYSIV